MSVGFEILRPKEKAHEFYGQSHIVMEVRNFGWTVILDISLKCELIANVAGPSLSASTFSRSPLGISASGTRNNTVETICNLPSVFESPFQSAVQIVLYCKQGDADDNLEMISDGREEAGFRIE
jgi:hypothetical protein